MDVSHLASFFRLLAATPTRRGVGRALAGSALAGVLLPLLGLTEADAKKTKRKKRRRKKGRQKSQSICAGRNVCTDGFAAVCGEGEFGTCNCFQTMRGESMCADFVPDIPVSCSDCGEGNVCLLDCEGRFACVRPCPNSR